MANIVLGIGGTGAAILAIVGLAEFLNGNTQNSIVLFLAIIPDLLITKMISNIP